MLKEKLFGSSLVMLSFRISRESRDMKAMAEKAAKKAAEKEAGK